jgi:hypothetical protein
VEHRRRQPSERLPRRLGGARRRAQSRAVRWMPMLRSTSTTQEGSTPSTQLSNRESKSDIRRPAAAREDKDGRRLSGDGLGPV